MRWTGLGGCVLAIAGCGGLGTHEPLTTPTAVDAGSAPNERRQNDAAPPAVVLDAGGDVATADGGPGPAGDGGIGAADAGLPFCPALNAPDAGLQIATGGWSPPTPVPFPCDPLPNALFFPRPAGDVAGAFARCASFADPHVTALAVSSDGTRAALVAIDGVARVVDLASRTVVGVLAPPRASVGLAAFSPAGDTIVTLAPGERAVTLWRTDSFTPIWTTTLPGQLYQADFGGGATFSPDGTTILLSPGAGVYLLDSATGSIRTSISPSGAVLSVAYGWNGQRIALLTAPVTGMCDYVPHGGSVAILDPTTLAQIATATTWPLEGDEAPDPGVMLVASAADLIVTSGTEDNPGVARAFRISDGTPLPDPPLTFSALTINYPLPLALTPDGTAEVQAQNGALQLVRLADGTVAASTAVDAPTALAVSADGSTIVAGSGGVSLLGVWRPATGPLVSICTADARSEDRAQPALSADGTTMAVDWGTEIRLRRRTDGAILSTMSHGGDQVWSVQLSPDGRYLVGGFYHSTTSSGSFPQVLFRTSDGVQIADLGVEASALSGTWAGFAFGSDGARLDAALVGPAKSTVVMQLDLETGAWTTRASAPDHSWLVGLSGDCPLLNEGGTTLVRACGGCQPRPLASETSSGLVSDDSTMYLGLQSGGETPSTMLWSIGPQPEVLRTYPARAGDAGWDLAEVPLAISTHGERVITGGAELAPCGTGRFTSRVHDVATDTLIDELPPNVTSSSADLNVLAFGPVIWCAR